MKKLSACIPGLFFLLSCLFITSCSDDDPIIWRVRGYQSLFTVIVEEDGYYFQSDRGNTFLPISPVYGYAPAKKQRAFVTYTLGPNESEISDYAMYVHRIDTILSKDIVENLYDKNENVYGNDPVKIEKIWIGGGFLNIKFGTYWGGKEAHFVNLLQEEEEDAILTFRHNAYDDPELRWGYGWVAFDLSGLETTTSGTRELTVQVNTYNGIQDFTFTYTSGEINTEEDIDEEEEISSALLF
ncbi:MAG: NigD-like protein [Tannerellaceae bacterium]|nr:NigD-like protein [Tannerellaceae bacterium]